MSKNNGKYNTQRAFIVKELAKKHEVSDAFVRLAIKGERDSDTAERIKKDFKELSEKITNILQ